MRLPTDLGTCYIQICTLEKELTELKQKYREEHQYNVKLRDDLETLNQTNRRLANRLPPTKREYRMALKTNLRGL